jgi:hypothetical protein
MSEGPDLVLGQRLLPPTAVSDLALGIVPVVAGIKTRNYPPPPAVEM